MSTVYVTGHKNPDLDSVCSAMAYAELKNRIDSDNEYIAIRCGHLSTNAKKILDSLNIVPPVYKRDIYPKVSDVCLKSDNKIDSGVLLNEVASGYDANNPSVIPIFENGNFYGLLSVDDISSWVMTELSQKGSIDSIPCVKNIMRTEERAINASDLFVDARELLASSQKRGLAVFDENGYIGYVTRRCFLKMPRHNVIMVDHNEPRQSIRGIETANIVEIIDHHRLDSVKTDLPIFIDAEPLGSTCTIVFEQYMRHGINPNKQIAKIMLTGIIADTLILRSPTTTAIDISYANKLANICEVDLNEFGLSMFKNMAGLKSEEPKKAISSDFKTYTENGVKLGIGQCEVTTLKDLSDYKDMFLSGLEEVRVANGLDWAVVMITDVLNENSVLLCTDYKANEKLQYTQMDRNVYDMPGVLSRKKQLLPELLHAL